MCEPLTIAAIGTYAIGTLQRAQAEKRAGEANAAILESDAHIADLAAADSVARGQAAAGRFRLEAGRTLAKQATGYAAAGVDTQSGSPLDVLSDTAGLSELDTQIIKNNAAREAWGHETQAADFRRRAILSRMTGQDQSEGTILGGVAGVATMGAKLLQIGGLSTADAYAGPSYTDWNDQGI